MFPLFSLVVIMVLLPTSSWILFFHSCPEYPLWSQYTFSAFKEHREHDFIFSAQNMVIIDE